MKDKDKKFILNIFDIDENGFDELVSKVKSLPDDGDECKENYIKSITENMPGRDQYEVKKILLHRL
ncbi:MAG: hypothetical protein ACQESP_03310 [Candidatus Muiribacteriota bacterium]